MTLLLQAVALGAMVNIGGQNLHVHCTGHGSPAVILESGTGDFSVIWSLVQPKVARFARVCSYDRGGYAWSDPGTRPRTFAQPLWSFTPVRPTTFCSVCFPILAA